MPTKKVTRAEASAQDLLDLGRALLNPFLLLLLPLPPLFHALAPEDGGGHEQISRTRCPVPG